eukprot:7079629-Pyramimonas_sp.AAC.1
MDKSPPSGGQGSQGTALSLLPVGRSADPSRPLRAKAGAAPSHFTGVPCSRQAAAWRLDEF